MRERLEGELLTEVQWDLTFLDVVHYRAVVLRVHHDAGVLVVLGRGANHGRSTDIDVLDELFVGSPLLVERLLKWVQVNHGNVDGRDAVLLHLRDVIGVIQQSQ